MRMIRLLTLIKTNWIVITLCFLTIITILSLWPLDELPSVPGSDKTHHLIAYAVLMFPTALRKPDKWILFTLFFIAYSAVIELLQPYVNRHGEWLDVLANTTGLFCGWILAVLVDFLFPVNSSISGE